MPAEFSTVGAKLALGAVIGLAPSFATARTTYMALLTSAPTDNSTIATLAEVNVSGYSRQAVSWTALTNTSPVAALNSSAVTFGPVTQAMPFPATHGALVSASSGSSGDFLTWWLLDNQVQAGLNESVQFAVGTLELDLT